MEGSISPTVPLNPNSQLGQLGLRNQVYGLLILDKPIPQRHGWIVIPPCHSIQSDVSCLIKASAEHRSAQVPPALGVLKSVGASACKLQLSATARTWTSRSRIRRPGRFALSMTTLLLLLLLLPLVLPILGLCSFHGDSSDPMKGGCVTEVSVLPLLIWLWSHRVPRFRLVCFCTFSVS